METPLYSLRMHASEADCHLSGAERLVGLAELETAALELLRRALEHPRGSAEQIRLAVDRLAPETVRSGQLPELRTLVVSDAGEGRMVAGRLLELAGVASKAAMAAVETLANGAAPDGGNMRGALLMDAASGRRLEADPRRGVRASRMDLSSAGRRALQTALAELGLDNAHVREALVLAGKVMAAPGVVAELCWSDDPDYTAGYVCARPFGYLRLPHLKVAGDLRGGRVFFLAPGTDLAALVAELETAPLLFDRPGSCHPAIPWRDYAPLLAAAT